MHKLFKFTPILHDKILFNIPPFGEVMKDADTSQILLCIEGKARLGSSSGLMIGSWTLEASHINVIFDPNGVLVATKF